MLRLIIKGNERDAVLAAMARGIELASAREHNPAGDMIETIATTNTAETLVQKWFCAAESEFGFGYPVGTLLWYGEDLDYALARRNEPCCGCPRSPILSPVV
jgi:hypothetical protein